MDSTRERDREDHRDSGKDRDPKDVDEDHHHHHHRSSTDKHRSKLEKHRDDDHEPRAAAHDGGDERVREESVERRRHSSERGGGDSEDRVSDEEKKERRGKRRFEDGCEEDTDESRDHANTAGSKVEKKTTTPVGPAGSLNPPPPPQSGLASIHDGIEAVSDNDAAGSQYEVSEQSRLAKERQEKAVHEFLMKRRAAALAVPTNDMAVRALLRRLGESITLFGEREMERRHRLRTLMAKLDNEDLERLIMKAHEVEKAAASATNDDEEEDNVQSYPFYTEGSLRLRQARLEITEYALKRADSRLKRSRRRMDADEIDLALNQAEGLTIKSFRRVGDDRPLSGCSFSYDGTILATCDLSGVAKLWSMPPQVTNISTLRGHTARATDVTFSPTDNNYVATASADRTARIWNSEGGFLRTFEGHLDRLARIAFHPSGKYLGTTSFDKTWRLWDVETGEELLLQEGHSRAVYGISFHPDGSLVATCGLDALTRVWDLRTGKSILALEGHVKPVLGVSFSPNGYHLASGGEDHTCRIWDLRKKKSVYVIPAHSNLVAQVKFEPRDGYSLVTASYDMTAKVWSSRDFKLVKTLSGHEAKVTSLDVTGHGQCVATVAHDRTIKLWSS